MKKTTLILLACTALHTGFVLAGPLDPECTAEKAAKSAAAKATVGVGGRCNPAEAVKDTAKEKTEKVKEKAKEKTDEKKEGTKDTAKKSQE